MGALLKGIPVRSGATVGAHSTCGIEQEGEGCLWKTICGRRTSKSR